ncbi:hypothetical protein, conserved [Eimeria brunetti]|uniref:Uncharacterized protein n=1 Tax=Eimeria brunetti TaxID=51314 RepID=U6LR52_9EIME|nr:hypothetical protein, conserved [Eimeria brunetti]
MSQLVALAPKSKFYKSPSFMTLSIEIAPGPYQSPLYAIVQALIYAILVPGALRGIRKGYESLMPSHGRCGKVMKIQEVNCPCTEDALGHILLCVPFCRDCPSPERVLPYRYGLAGIATGNVMFAGLLYLAYLVVVSSLVFRKLKEDPDNRKVQCRIVSLNCAYIAASGIFFYTNLIAVYGGVGDFVALEPAVFFTANRIFELNIGTIIGVVVLLSMWGMAYHEQSQMDESGKNVSSMSSVALSTHEESRRALEEALNEMRTGVYRE